MEKVKEFLKKFWVVILGVLGVLVAVIFTGKKKIPPTLVKPPENPPEEVKDPEVKKTYDKEKEKSDEKIAKMDRDDLVNDINSKYK